MTIYYVEEMFYKTHTAGSKPRNDFNSFLNSLGYQPIQQPESLPIPNLTIQEYDVFFIQYTFTGNWKKTFFLFLSGQGAKTVLFINDISCLHDGNDRIKEEEIALFNQATCLIIHNEKMKQWLINQGVKTKLIVLELFDYLIDPHRYVEIPTPSFEKNLIFAGNLNPILRQFLYDPSYQHHYHLNLYGPEVEGELQKQKTTYIGSFPPEEIPFQLKGSFGLLWNGPSQDSCIGYVAQYSKIATSHKLSLYLLAKLPVICWKEAAEASFIVKNKIGFTISSLTEIDERLNALTEEEYEKMVQHVKLYSERIVSGFYFHRALVEVFANI